MSAYQQLKAQFQHYKQLQDLQSILRWDEAVMMPQGSGPQRAAGIATLNTMSEKLLIVRKNARLLEAAKTENLNGWDQANLRWMEKKYRTTVCLPTRLISKITTEAMASEQAWRRLRSQNDWKSFLPTFKKLFKLVKEVAERRGQALELSPYDALLDEYAPGFNQNAIDQIFKGLKTEIPPLLQRIIQQQAHQNPVQPQGPFAIEKQKALGKLIMKDLGFNFEHGRLDESHHPFCGGTADDVRITTRYKENEFFSSIAGICHESGHALYEQNLPREWLDQPVGGVNSMAMHESQSLLMESLVCASPEFYQYLSPLLIQAFGAQPGFEATNLHHLASRVKPLLIRVDSDEITYQMHIILRYEIEKELFSGELEIKELPERWHQLMSAYLDLPTRQNYKDGVMQDVHWPSGAFGYFPAYTLGRLISAQLFATFLKEQPAFFQGLAQGQFEPIRTWLKDKIHSKASSQSTQALLKEVTGKTLDASYFLNHIKQRYLNT